MSQARDQSAVIDALTALSHLVEVDALPPWLVARAAGIDVATTAGDHPAVRRRQDGWFLVDRAPRSGGPRAEQDVDVLQRAADGALDHLTGMAGSLRDDAPTTPGGQTAADARRWLRVHEKCVLAVADAANAADLPAAASPITALLRTVAEVAGFDPGFVRALTETAARSAVAERDPESLGAALRSAWVWFERRGDLAAAEEYAAREWDLWRRAGRTADAVRLLWWRAEISRRRGRADLELRCYERLESLHDTDSVDADERAALVRVWAAAASALLAHDRADLAVDWARRAEHAVRALPDFPPVEQALVFEWSGRALWASDAVGPARRRFSEALALLVDVDDTAADRIRRLLTHDRASPLPPATPDRYPAPVPPPSTPS
ncbi:hypothetical protein ACFYOT_28120 [Saccharothrix saharensis]|uniref:hypothetical protein n=1 Tax=Saccharothrix saharensis TaxID=571190 RepID=UPI0036B39FF3